MVSTEWNTEDSALEAAGCSLFGTFVADGRKAESFGSKRSHLQFVGEIGRVECCTGPLMGHRPEQRSIFALRSILCWL